MKFKKNILIICIVSFLSVSCANKKQNEEIKSIVDNRKDTILFIDKQCEKFPEFKGKTYGDLYSFIVSDVFINYKNCYDINKANVEILERLKKNEQDKK